LYVFPYFRITSLIESAHLTDCGIRPATSAEAEWLQDYIHKSNNHAGQPSVNAARLAQEQADATNGGEGRSDEDEDEDSEGVNSVPGSKRNSLSLTGDVKGGVFPNDLADKTPTAATLLSQVQAASRPSFPSQASIRRHPGEGGLPVQSQSPSSTNPLSYPGSQQHPLSVRQFPHFPSIDEAVGTNSTTPQGMAAREVWGWFQDHLDTLLESVRSFRFDQFEMHLRTFWTNLNGSHREIVHAPAIAGLMAKADAIVYDVRQLHLDTAWS
jgi:regulatory factor X, other